jgi:predicted metal-dependent RNase
MVGGPLKTIGHCLAEETCDEETLAINFDFVFAVPQFLSSPRSLRDLILHQDNHPFLDEKVELSKQLANSVAFVNKNVRPEIILVFE